MTQPDNPPNQDPNYKDPPQYYQPAQQPVQPQQVIVQNYHPDSNLAKRKSYEVAYVITLLLYSLGWIPGFITNIVLMNEAKRMETIAGQSLPGTGFLIVTFWINLILVILGVLFLIIAIVLSIAGVAIFSALE